MKIYISSDHGGFGLKAQLANFLVTGLGQPVEVVDLGSQSLEPEDDYPIYAFKLAETVVRERLSGAEVFGILACRSGNGMAIAANKVKGARAALCVSVKHAQKAREDDHANILVLPGDYVLADSVEEVTKAFLEAKELPDRHERRVQEVIEYEQRHG
jgi:ribose 5-phosphate isomerase B